MRRTALVSVIAATVAAAPPAASADTLVAAAPRAANLAAGFGFIAWARPVATGRWRIVVRAPTGAVGNAPIPTFGAAPHLAIGHYRGRAVIAYSRCAGKSAFKSCDIWVYDFAAAVEHRVRGLATKSHSETAPDVDAKGRWSFVRRDWPARGVYTMNASGQPWRVSSQTALETAVTQSYVVVAGAAPHLGITAYRRHPTGDELSGTLGFGRQVDAVPHALVAVGGRAYWLDTPAKANSTIPLDPNGRGHKNVTSPAYRPLPATTNSIAASGDQIDLYLDADGVMRVSEPLFMRFG